MTEADYKIFNEHLQGMPKAAQENFLAVRELIRQVAPEAEEAMNFRIPAFKIGEIFLICYAGSAAYTMISSLWSNALLKAFRSELIYFKTSAAAIHFPNNKPLPMDLIKSILIFRKKEVDAKT